MRAYNPYNKPHEFNWFQINEIRFEITKSEEWRSKWRTPWAIQYNPPEHSRTSGRLKKEALVKADCSTLGCSAYMTEYMTVYGQLLYPSGIGLSGDDLI